MGTSEREEAKRKDSEEKERKDRERKHKKKAEQKLEASKFRERHPRLFRWI